MNETNFKCPLRPNSNPARSPTDHQYSIDALRGFASLSVCWYHITHGNDLFLKAGLLRSSGLLGYLGVPVFFVVSGFIIPLALYAKQYSISRFHIFLLKRVARIDPPYIAGIALVLALGYVSTLSPLYHGKAFVVNLSQILCHIGYVTSFAKKQWLNPVFWTLGIEFQYYVLIGLIFPALSHPTLAVRLPFTLAFSAMGALTPRTDILFYWAPMFGLGIACFQYRAGLSHRSEFAFCVVFSALATFLRHGWLEPCATLLTAFAILFVNVRHPLLAFFGAISYSLYLVHCPIGGRIVNLSINWSRSEPVNWLIAFAALFASIIAATAFYGVFERPSKRLSASLGYAGWIPARFLRRPEWCSPQVANERQDEL